MPSRDVVESVGDAELIAEVTGGQLGREVTLQYSTSDGTAMSEYLCITFPMHLHCTADAKKINSLSPCSGGMDYTAVSGSITFSPSVSQQSILVAIINDSVREDRETLTVSLTGAPDRVMLNPTQGTIGILDDDGKITIFIVQVTCEIVTDVIIGFDPDTYTSAEDSRRVEVTVMLLGGTLSSDAIIVLRTSSGTALSKQSHPLTHL